MNITLSTEELFALIYGDDNLTEQRGWILRNTAASGYCTVIDEDFALQFLANDAAEAYSHIEVYDTNEMGKIYTLWRPFEWNDSTEKKRLLKVKSSEWRKHRDKKLECELLVETGLSMLVDATGWDKKTLGNMRDSLMLRAQTLEYDTTLFKMFLAELGSKFGVKLVKEEKDGNNKSQPES